VRSIASFLQAHDPHEAERKTKAFLVLHQRVSPQDKQKLEAIWREAKLGLFPTET
jgi:hypothetical protein